MTFIYAEYGWMDRNKYCYVAPQKLLVYELYAIVMKKWAQYIMEIFMAHTKCLVFTVHEP